MRRKLRLLALLVILAIVAAPLAGIWVNGYLSRALPLDKPVVVEVQRGESYSGMIARLGERGLLGSGMAVTMRRLAARLYAMGTGLDEHLSVGEYQLNPGDSLGNLLDRIERGQVLQHSVTLVDGWTFKQWRHVLDGLKALKHDSKGLTGEQIMQRLGMPDMKPEGWFAPNTYFYTRGTSDLEVMHRAMERQRSTLDAAWRDRADNLPYDKPYQALIMASIIEKETAEPKERGMIAGVFINRLRKGMRLQTDPTVIYGMGDRYHGKLHRSDLLRPGPYNTYLNTGLPPTPIAMPGKPAILAALHPDNTQALYFVARGDGSHVFSRTLEEQRRAIRKYQLNRRPDYRSSPEPIPDSDQDRSSGGKAEANR